MTEIKSCPFCGSNEVYECETNTHWIRCQDCEAKGPTAENAEDAIEFWNQRIEQ